MALFDYKIERAMREGMKTLLENNGLSAKVQGSADDLKTPYVTVGFELGAELEVDVPTASGGISNLYEGQFSFSIVTDRENNGDQNDELLGKVREVVAESTGAQYAAALGARHAVRKIRHAVTAYDVLDKDDGLDVSAMLYPATIELRQA